MSMSDVDFLCAARCYQVLKIPRPHDLDIHTLRDIVLWFSPSVLALLTPRAATWCLIRWIHLCLRVTP